MYPCCWRCSRHPVSWAEPKLLASWYCRAAYWRKIWCSSRYKVASRPITPRTPYPAPLSPGTVVWQREYAEQTWHPSTLQHLCSDLDEMQQLQPAFECKKWLRRRSWTKHYIKNLELNWKNVNILFLIADFFETHFSISSVCYICLVSYESYGGVCREPWTMP